MISFGILPVIYSNEYFDFHTFTYPANTAKISSKSSLLGIFLSEKN